VKTGSYADRASDMREDEDEDEEEEAVIAADRQDRKQS
jgi:hypothetical protein